MIRYLFIVVSCLTLIGTQLMIYNVFRDINSQLNNFFEKETVTCKIENTRELESAIGRGTYTEIQTDCGNYPILLEDFTNSDVIKKGSYLSKKPQNNEFEVFSNNKSYHFILTSYKDYEMTLRILFFISTVIVISVTYYKLFINKS
ncbi:hypothetical protein SAMN05443634_11217 [Chishuiella changwenlii]|uniref:Uncharacterized protein n=1 Tax=Chishuiella changwenlii TaxID=1434701 RepID=A0A1M7BXW0_9FLAO|nr:hypothetical protein [Chishuiella changwenlii]GGE91512.1 hypothetical protein GCM10010984_06540 [Chishuiella changwenlii]SHL59862.1 hypothetical protein SAMN05443634_11217 [Chishuiella changwenlii]